jgi:hypothetical protein
LRKIAAPGVNFPDRTWPRTEYEPDLSADPCWVTSRTYQADADAWLGRQIVKELRRGSVLAHCQVYPAVLVKIRHRGATLLTIDQDSGFLPRNRREIARAIASQEKSSTSIVSRDFWLIGEEILAQENVFKAVAIKVGHVNAERRRILSLGGKRAELEPVSAV